MIFNYLYFNPIRFRPSLYIDHNKSVNYDLDNLFSDDSFKRIQTLFFSQRTEKTPYFYFCGTHEIPQLKEFSLLNQYKFIKRLSKIDFYFFEPLTHYVDGINYSYVPHVLRCNNEDYELENIKSKELDSISEWVYENKIENLTVYCTEYLSDKYYKNVYKNLDLKHLDVLTLTISKNISKRKDHYFSKKINYETIKKKFIIPTWRYDPVRHFLVSYIVKQDIHHDSHLSFYYNIQSETMIKNMWFNQVEFEFKFPNFLSNIIEGNEKINNISPITFDADNTKPVYDHRLYPNYDKRFNVIKSHRPEKYYDEAVISIISESRFTQPWPNISEKTLNSIIMLKPFIMVAAPGTLAMLKEMGFKTFGDYWDESYDSIIHNDERLIRICETIKNISQMPLEDLVKMYKDMEHILYHNLKNIEKLEKFYKKYNKS